MPSYSQIAYPQYANSNGNYFYGGQNNSKFVRKRSINTPHNQTQLIEQVKTKKFYRVNYRRRSCICKRCGLESKKLFKFSDLILFRELIPKQFINENPDTKVILDSKEIRQKPAIINRGSRKISGSSIRHHSNHSKQQSPRQSATHSPENQVFPKSTFQPPTTNTIKTINQLDESDAKFEEKGQSTLIIKNDSNATFSQIAEQSTDYQEIERESLQLNDSKMLQFIQRVPYSASRRNPQTSSSSSHSRLTPSHPLKPQHRKNYSQADHRVRKSVESQQKQVEMIRSKKVSCDLSNQKNSSLFGQSNQSCSLVYPSKEDLINDKFRSICSFNLNCPKINFLRTQMKSCQETRKRLKKLQIPLKQNEDKCEKSLQEICQKNGQDYTNRFETYFVQKNSFQTPKRGQSAACSPKRMRTAPIQNLKNGRGAFTPNSNLNLNLDSNISNKDKSNGKFNFYATYYSTPKLKSIFPNQNKERPNTTISGAGRRQKKLNYDRKKSLRGDKEIKQENK